MMSQSQVREIALPMQPPLVSGDAIPQKWEFEPKAAPSTNVPLAISLSAAQVLGWLAGSVSFVGLVLWVVIRFWLFEP
jgi:hypothetical protein